MTRSPSQIHCPPNVLSHLGQQLGQCHDFCQKVEAISKGMQKNREMVELSPQDREEWHDKSLTNGLKRVTNSLLAIDSLKANKTYQKQMLVQIIHQTSTVRKSLSAASTTEQIESTCHELQTVDYKYQVFPSSQQHLITKLQSKAKCQLILKF